jgi:hypothetical protein
MLAIAMDMVAAVGAIFALYAVVIVLLTGLAFAVRQRGR